MSSLPKSPLLVLSALAFSALALTLATGCSSGGTGDGGGSGDPGAPPLGDSATAGAYLPDDGLIVVEMESGLATGSWAEETSLTGFTGSGYLRWAGANMYSAPGADAFGFDFWIEEPGEYSFRIHNRHDHPDSTLANDLWVRMDEGDWVKAFSWQRGQWTWATNHEFSPSNKPEARYDLTAGNHRIEFSGRSTDFSVDRFHLFDAGVADPMNTSYPESSRAGVSGSPAAPGSAGMIVADASRTSLVSLRAAALTDRAMEPWLSSAVWSIPGASFADGTSARSMNPVVVVQGGAALPVRLELMTEDGTREFRSVLNVDGAAAQLAGEPFIDGTLELHFALHIEDVIEVVGGRGERASLRAIPSANGLRVTLRPTSSGLWSYRGRRSDTGEVVQGQFVVAR
ncbi:hypothetical protein Poly30_01210 [Planctomycetes bacterium Poly30]|uniref:Uncharacterized protein n=1 Tax=Saltatorellus ferox TaxID=2528018 RepID=A0A518EKM1_9BACT|nr:hypothetical protein Poly30_01210 [Planctomycetes bacterium Poly30]